MKRKPVSPKSVPRTADTEFENLLRMASTRTARVKATPLRVAGERKTRAASD